MNLQGEFAIALAKVEKMQSDARVAFLSRLGQLEEDLKSGDVSSIIYSAALLLKAYEQSSPSYAGALRALCACATRLTVGKTRKTFKRLNVLNTVKDDYYGTTIKDTETDANSEFENDFKKLSLLGQTLITRWNEILSLPRVTTLRGRTTAIRRAMNSSFFKTYWQEGLSLLARNKFLTGGGSKRWRANIDWFIAPPNLENIISGQYDDKKPLTQNKKYDDTEI